MSDAGNEVAGQFNLVYEFPEKLKDLYQKMDINLPEYNGNDRWELPLPARYVVDTSGEIIDAVAFVDHTERVEPSETLEIMRSLE